MFLTRSEYDRGVNTFSPEGRLFQVEYAIEAIKRRPSKFSKLEGSTPSEKKWKKSFEELRELGSTAIGIQTSEGVVLGVEKRVTSTLMKPVTIEKIVEIDKHIGCAVSGLMADSRTMIDRARVEAANHWFVYDEPMDVESIAQSVSNLAIQFGDSDDDGNAMSRPFGVAILFGGADRNSVPKLFHMDPSGTYVQYDAKAIGSGSEGAQQALQEHYDKQMTLKQALELNLKILKQVMEEKLNSSNVEIATVTKDTGFHMYTKEEVEDVLKDLNI